MTAHGRQGEVANGRFVESRIIDGGFGKSVALEKADPPYWAQLSC